MEEKKLDKLNTKRTVIVGLAFFTILMMWQIYNTYCPLFLKDLMTSHFGEGDYEYIIGLIMAADNILALFMLPLFGTLSDKTKTRLGKRMPYIIGGTMVGLAIFPFIPFLFLQSNLWGVIVLMGILLISMNIYRNPAVALMPDMTPKPLRSKANAIINLVGYTGAILAGVLAIIFSDYAVTSIIWPFVITSIFMVLAILILVLRINENRIADQMKEQMEIGEKLSESVDKVEEDKPLTKANRRNLILLIASVFLWFFAFNAVETFWSTYAVDLGIVKYSIGPIIIVIASIIAFLPSAMLTRKFGRKKVIIMGLCSLIAGLVVASILGITMARTGPAIWAIVIMYGMLAISGAGWALVNVNSYPMVVKMASKKKIGKYTGYYYTSSMLAQSITPAIIGFVMGGLGYEWFFPYATIFMSIALLVFSFVTTKEMGETTNIGDKPEKKKREKKIKKKKKKISMTTERVEDVME